MSNSRNTRRVPRSAVDEGLVDLVQDTREFVCQVVKQRCPDVLDRLDAERRGRMVVPDDIRATGDPTGLLAVLQEAWDEAFKDVVNAPGVGFQLVDKVRIIRNDFVHDFDKTFTDDDLRAIDDLRRGLTSGRPGRRARGEDKGEAPAWVILGLFAIVFVAGWVAGMAAMIQLVPSTLMFAATMWGIYGIGWATAMRVCRVRGKSAAVLKLVFDVMFWSALGFVAMELMRHGMEDTSEATVRMVGVVIWFVGAVVMLSVRLHGRTR